jgi:hypothetical protein
MQSGSTVLTAGAECRMKTRRGEEFLPQMGRMDTDKARRFVDEGAGNGLGVVSRVN